MALSRDELLTVNPAVRIGIISGQADFAAFRLAGVRMFPEQPRPSWLHVVPLRALGPRGVLELYTAGSESRRGDGARPACRLLARGDPADRALRESPAMDFVHS